MLTGKCKEDFEYWLLKVRNEKIQDGSIEYDLYYVFKYIVPESCRKELIIEFFDSVNIYVNAIRYSGNFKPIANYELQEVCSTRQEALYSAINEANKIYNHLNKD